MPIDAIHHGPPPTVTLTCGLPTWLPADGAATVTDPETWLRRYGVSEGTARGFGLYRGSAVDLTVSASASS